MYTSVHYVIRPNKSYTAEIQVRTLAEELWGEVDHKINYPVRSEIFACSEQLKVLARTTSACTRLVDSIFGSHKHKSKKIILCGIKTGGNQQQIGRCFVSPSSLYASPNISRNQPGIRYQTFLRCPKKQLKITHNFDTPTIPS